MHVQFLFNSTSKESYYAGGMQEACRRHAAIVSNSIISDTTLARKKIQVHVFGLSSNC